MTIEIVISSTNPGKIAEILEIMQGLDVKWLTQANVGGWPEIEETEDSYLGNALAKARAVCRITGKAALADDSGIEVDALDGEPGVHSARWGAGGVAAAPRYDLGALEAANPPNQTGAGGDQDNNEKLRRSMQGLPPDRRGARYRCAAVVVFPEGEEIAAMGTCEGRIGESPAGSGGFGYDPWFVPAGETRSMAELSANEKHAISHRGKALRDLRSKIEQRSRVKT